MTTVSTKGKMIHFLYKNLVRRQQKLNNNFPIESLCKTAMLFNITLFLCFVFIIDSSPRQWPLNQGETVINNDKLLYEKMNEGNTNVLLSLLTT